MPTFDRDPFLVGRRLDVVLHDSTHPVRLPSFHFRTGEDVIAILGIRSLAPPSPQFLNEILIKRDWILRLLGLHTAHALLYN